MTDWSRWKKMMKTVAISRLGDVTKLLQTQQRDSQWRMQDFVNGGAFPLSIEPTRAEVRGITPVHFYARQQELL